MSTSIMALTGFTSDFTTRLGESRRRLDDFAATNEKRADSILADLKKIEAEEQRGIDSLLRQLKTLQSERGVVGSKGSGGGGADGGVAEQRKKLENKQVKLEQEVSMLKSKNRVEQAQLDEVLAEEEIVRKKADEVRRKKEEIEMNRRYTVEDLTRGLMNYKFTGLTFEKDGMGGMCFMFKKLDREDVSREFTFTLSMNDTTDYQLSEVNPPLDERKTNPLLDNLNTDAKNGFNSFVVGMRKLFKETIQ